jgi:cytosine/adenosine deaminase-related metal-dependent hydrolase
MKMNRPKALSMGAAFCRYIRNIMQTAGETLLVRGARVLDLDGNVDEPPVHDLLIRNGAIEKMGEGLSAPGARVIDAAGMLAVPGFVNAHYHSHDVLARGMFEDLSLEHWGVLAGPLGSKRPLAEVRARTLAGALECLRNGITTVQDMAAFAPMDEEVLDTILGAYADTGIRVVFGVTVRDRSQLETILHLEELVPPALREVIGTARDPAGPQIDFVERQIDRHRDMHWALTPSAPQRCTPALLEAVADLSRRRSLPVYTHVYESRLQRIFAHERLKHHGGSALRLMQACGLLGPNVTIAHGVWPDPAELELIASSGTNVAINMLSNLKLKSGVAPILEYRARGVNLALGCDNCSCSDTQNMFQVMKLFCLLAAVCSPETTEVTAAEAFRAATLGGARTAGLADTVGALRPGRRADVVLIDLADPAWRPFNSAVRQLVYSESGRAVRTVIVDGRVVVENGRVVTVDERALGEEIAALMPRVRSDVDRLRAGYAEVRTHIDEAQRRARTVPLPMNRFLGNPP